MSKIFKSNSLEGELISPWDLTGRELLWLEQALQTGYDKGQVKTVLAKAAEGKAQIWRLSAPQVAGIAVTRIFNLPEFRECDAWLLGGFGLLTQLGNLGIMLRAYAKDQGCKVVHANVIPELAKVYTRRFGFRHDMTSMIMEV